MMRIKSEPDAPKIFRVDSVLAKPFSGRLLDDRSLATGLQRQQSSPGHRLADASRINCIRRKLSGRMQT